MFGRLARSASSRPRRYQLAAAVTSATVVVAAYTYHNKESNRHIVHASSSSAASQARPTTSATSSTSQQQPSLLFPLSRSDSIAALKRPDVLYDLLIIGGGATGSGIALDATLRGLDTALVEAADFSSGASSRSTKLIHGGIRYLQKAFTQLDVAQYNLVREALTERRHLLTIAPHLAHSFPIIVPVYAGGVSGLFWVPYYWVGCKLYDVVAGRAAVLEQSYYLSAKRAIDKFPMLKDDGLWGGVVYYDGQHNDTRMNVSIVLTAAAHGANVANHCRVTSLLTEAAAAAGEKGSGRVVGARVRDELTGEEWNIRAREVINATGPLTDSVRHMADPSSPSCITPSAGIHIVLPASYSPPDMGLIVPKTSDGRVLFMLPWEGSTLVGTTDYLSPVTALPSPHESDIDFLLREISGMLKVDVRREDVRSVWSGIRPLARDVKATSTENVNRDHLIERTWDGLTTISGGKWTTYRKMAEDVLDTVLKRQDELRDKWEREPGSGQLRAEWLIDTSRVKPCSTWCYPLLGTHHFTPQLADDLLAQYGSRLSATTSTAAASRSSSTATPPSASLTTSPSHTTASPTPSSIIHHLTHNYGDRAPLVLSLASQRSDFSLLSPHFPFLTAELLYSVHYEYAMRAVDVLAHRTRLCFLDTAAAEAAVSRVVDVMGGECGWDGRRRREEVRQAKRFLETMKCSATKDAKADAAAAVDPGEVDEDDELTAVVA